MPTTATTPEAAAEPLREFQACERCLFTTSNICVGRDSRLVEPQTARRDQCMRMQASTQRAPDNYHRRFWLARSS